MHLRALTTQAEPRSSRQSERFAVLPIVTHTSTPPHIARFSEPLHTDIFEPRTSVRCHQAKSSERPHNSSAAPRARRVKPGAKGAAKAERSDRRAREDYGWGWVGGVIKPNHPTNPNTPPPNTRGSTSRTSPPAHGPTATALNELVLCVELLFHPADQAAPAFFLDHAAKLSLVVLH